MTFYVSIIYELGGSSFYGLLLPPPGLLHHPAISLVLAPLFVTHCTKGFDIFLLGLR